MFAPDLFDDRVALVTGAGRGIGQSIAVALAEHGADVVVNDVDEETCAETADTIEDLGRTALALPFDVTKPDAVEASIRRAREELGVIQHVVNNAGTSSTESLLDLEPAEWDGVMNVNAKGTFLVARAAAHQCIDAGIPASMANVASLVAVAGPQPGTGSYSPSKSAIRKLSEQMALEWAEHDIRVNAICPGLTRTPAGEAIYSDAEIRREREAWVPVGRIGEPEDIARAALFVLAPQNTYLTGESLVVDGGGQNVGIDRIPGRSERN